jgi:hypothetical protein
LSIQATDLPEVSLDLPKAACLEQIFGQRGRHVLYILSRLTFQAAFAALKANVQILRTSRAHDVSQFAVTSDESEPVTLSATWRFRFAKPERVVSSPCSLTSINCSTAPHDMSSRHLSHAPSHLRGIISLDSSDHLSGDHGDASCASEINSNRILDAGCDFKLLGSGKQFW